MTSLRRLLGATAGLLVLTTAPWTVTDASAAPPAPARTASRAPILRADYRFADVRASNLPGAPDLTDIGGTNTFTAATIDGTERVSTVAIARCRASACRHRRAQR